MANELPSLALKLGPLKLFKAFLGLSEHDMTSRLVIRDYDHQERVLERAAVRKVQLSGVHLTDVEGYKDVANTMLIGAFFAGLRAWPGLVNLDHRHSYHGVHPVRLP